MSCEEVHEGEDPQGEAIVFIGREQYQDFLRAALEFGVGMSPAEAARRIGCTRQNVTYMMNHGSVRAVIYKEHPRASASWCIVAESDVLGFVDAIQNPDSPSKPLPGFE